MNVHYFNPGVVGDERNPTMKASLDVYPNVLDDETKVVVKLEPLSPRRARLGLFIDLATFVENVLAHPHLDVIQRHAVQLLSDEAMGRFGQVELDVVRGCPFTQCIHAVAQRIKIGLKAIWIG
jgi:hypothetical protein